MSKNLLSGLLAVTFMLVPAFAMAEEIVKLQPLQNPAAYDTNAAGPTVYNTYNTYPVANSGTTANAGNDTISLRGRVTSVPQGTMMMIRLDQPISSFGARMGDPISATLENDIFVNDAIVIPAGSQVLGQVANVAEAGHLGKHGEIDVRFTSVKLSDGRTLPLNAHLVTSDQSGILKGDTYTNDVLKGIGIAAGGTGVGTLMGTAAGGLIGSVGGGALFGLGVGALGGMGYALARKGKEVVVPANSRMSLMIDSDVTIDQ